MIRPLLTEFGLFLIPFAIYAAFLLVTRAGVLDPDVWSWRVIGWLTAAALLLVLISFLVIAQFSGAPAGSTYEPARFEGGRLVPGSEH